MVTNHGDRKSPKVSLVVNGLVSPLHKRNVSYLDVSRS